jgi:hypothetical protein
LHEEIESMEKTAISLAGNIWNLSLGEHLVVHDKSKKKPDREFIRIK